MNYFLVYGCIPVCEYKREIVKLKYRTDNIISISRELFDYIECEYLIYFSNIRQKLREKNK